jgi:putative sigma-54 modulation protein
MKIRITHKNTEVPQEIHEFIEDKCGKLKKFAPTAEEVDIVFKKEKDYRYFAEINLPVRGAVIHGEAQAGDLFSSFEEALKKVERQIKKRREKIVEHKNQRV